MPVCSRPRSVITGKGNATKVSKLLKLHFKTMENVFKLKCLSPQHVNHYYKFDNGKENEKIKEEK